MKKHMWWLLGGGLIAGLLAIFVVRIVTVKSNAVHYHADFALYVNGARDEFNGPGYYEEVSTCSTNDHDNPKARVHMHNQENSIVHVHDHAVTWGAFFNNLGYTLGDNVLATNNGIFTNNGTSKLSFILNGKPVDAIADRVIGNEDVLLVDYGADDATTIQKDYASIPRKAHAENLEKDPASCGGASPHLSVAQRLKKAAQFWQ